jgi:hypothetical protein
MKYFILEKAVQNGVKITDKENRKFILWKGLTKEQVQRIFLTAAKIPFPEATNALVNKYFDISTVALKPGDGAFDWHHALTTYPHTIQKSEVRPFVRTRLGKWERVSGYMRAGEKFAVKKAIKMAVVAVMLQMLAGGTVALAQNISGTAGQEAPVPASVYSEYKIPVTKKHLPPYMNPKYSVEVRKQYLLLDMHQETAPWPF